MRVRLALVLSLVVAAGSASPGIAATKKKPKPPPPVCNLLVDPVGDGGGVLKSKALDFTGADVATGKKTVVGVIRVVSTATANDPDLLLGASWTLNFSVKGVKYSFTRTRAAGTAARYTYGFSNGTTPTVVESPTEIRFTVPRSTVPELKKANMVLDTIAVTSQIFTNGGESGTTPRTYRDLTPSCLKPA